MSLNPDDILGIGVVAGFVIGFVFGVGGFCLIDFACDIVVRRILKKRYKSLSFEDLKNGKFKQT